MEWIDAIFDEFKKALLTGEKVSVMNFGTFKISKRPPKDINNPKTGEMIHSEGNYHLDFTVSYNFFLGIQEHFKNK